jgi:transposase
MSSTRLALTPEQRAELERRDRSRRGRADAARRARVILLLADGGGYATITAKTGCSSRTIALWRHRFEASGLDDLLARHRGVETDRADRLQPHRLERYMRSTDPDFETRRSDEAHRMIAVPVVRTVRSQIVIVMRYVSGS